MKNFLLFALLFLSQVFFTQSPPTPGGGGGGTAPGERDIPIDMYIPLLMIVAVLFIAYFAFSRTKQLK